MGSISEKKQNKLTNIIDAACELFTIKSFSGTSIDDVVKKAGVAKGTFYLYFKDKYDLMDRIVIRKSAGVLKSALDTVNSAKKSRMMNFSQQMMLLIDYIVEYLVANKELVTLVGKRFSSSIRAIISNDDDEIKPFLNELIESNSENGFSAEETTKLIYIIVDLIGSVCYDALIYETPYKIDDIKPILMNSVSKILS